MMTPGLRERRTEPPPGADRDGSHCRLWVLGDTGMHACGALPSRPAFVQMGVCHGFPDMGLPLTPTATAGSWLPFVVCTAPGSER